MKNNGHPNIPLGLVVEPVHEDHKRENAHQEIDTVNPAGCHQIALVIILDKRKRDVPDAPVKGENQGRFKQAEFAAQAIGAVGVPAQLFEKRGHDEQKPDGENTGGEGVMSGDRKLRGTVPKQQRNGLGKQDAPEHQKSGQEQVNRLNGFEIKKPAEQVFFERVVFEDKPEGNGHRAQ